MTDLSHVEQLIALDHGLSVVVTLRPDHTPQTSVVNAGVLMHPLSGAAVVAFVAGGRARKLANLRANPAVTVVVRAGWQWASVEGRAELMGPDDPHPDIDDERLRLLLREIFTSAGGTHDDWENYDTVMRDERRTAVIVTPTRVYPS
jgi:PPOX class probable F420-dependent enzyme